MDLILVAVTGLSLLMAAAMGVMLARVLREERRRSDARVELLAELAAEPAKASPAGSVTIARAEELFQPGAEPSPWPRRLVVIGSMAAALALAVFAMQSTIGTPERAKGQAAAVAAGPLELLSLRHSQDGGSLTVTGLVQNPRGAVQLSGVEASVLIFGADGGMLTSGRAPLDFTTLGAGDESPFVIRVPVEGTVARYRIGFRGADGRVIGHVDRRSPEALAHRQEP